MKEHKVNAPLSWREWENRLCLLRFKTFREVTTTLFLVFSDEYYYEYSGSHFSYFDYFATTFAVTIFFRKKSFY